MNPFENLGFWCVAVFSFLAFSRIADFYLSPLHLPLVMSTVSLIAVVLTGRLMVPLQHRIGASLVCLTIWFFICIPFAYWRGGSYFTITNEWIKSFAAFVVIGGLLSSVRQVSALLKVIGFSLMVTVLLAFLKPGSVEGRLTLYQGQYSGPNELGGAMVLAAIYCYFLSHNPAHSKLVRMVGTVALAPVFWVLLKTGSRGALIALAVATLVIFFRYSGVAKAAFALACLLGLGASVLFLPADLKARYFTLFTSEDAASEEETRRLEMAAGSANQRWHLAKQAMRLTLTHPIFGVGPGNFATAENDRSMAEGRPKGSWLGTHNTYLQISSESGFPGLFLLLACLMFCWRDLLAAERLAHIRNAPFGVRFTGFALRLVLVNYTVFFFFEHVGYAPYFVAACAMILAYAECVKREYPATAAVQNPAAGTAVSTMPAAASKLPAPAPAAVAPAPPPRLSYRPPATATAPGSRPVWYPSR